MVWRTLCEEFHRKYTVPTVKHAAGSVMVWSCFTRLGVRKLCVLHRIMDRFDYRDILEQNLFPSIDHFKLGQQCHFMHDNDGKHTSGLVKHCLKQKTIETLLFTEFKSHRELERRVEKHQAKNAEEVEVELRQEWVFVKHANTHEHPQIRNSCHA